MTLIEYSDLPPALREARGTPTGRSRSPRATSPSTRCASTSSASSPRGDCSFRSTSRARSSTVLGADGSRREVAGIKFETFIFDALAKAADPLAMEVRREDEFAPIKNATGADSPATSRALQSDCRRPHARSGRRPASRATRRAQPVVPIEISPLFAAVPKSSLPKVSGKVRSRRDIVA